VESITFSGGLKTVVVSRPLDNGYFAFDASMMQLPFINALGSTLLFAYHRVHSISALTFLPVEGPAGAVAGLCICEGHQVPFGSGQGTFTYNPTSQPADTGSGSVEFANVCPPMPRGDLLEQYIRRGAADVPPYVVITGCRSGDPLA